MLSIDMLNILRVITTNNIVIFWSNKGWVRQGLVIIDGHHWLKTMQVRENVIFLRVLYTQNS